MSIMNRIGSLPLPPFPRHDPIRISNQNQGSIGSNSRARASHSVRLSRCFVPSPSCTASTVEFHCFFSFIQFVPSIPTIYYLSLSQGRRGSYRHPSGMPYHLYARETARRIEPRTMKQYSKEASRKLFLLLMY